MQIDKTQAIKRASTQLDIQALQLKKVYANGKHIKKTSSSILTTNAQHFENALLQLHQTTTEVFPEHT